MLAQVPVRPLRICSYVAKSLLGMKYRDSLLFGEWGPDV